MTVGVDSALRFGSLLHMLREHATPLLLQRVPVETKQGWMKKSSKALLEWLDDSPPPLASSLVRMWKEEALRHASPYSAKSANVAVKSEPVSMVK